MQIKRKYSFEKVKSNQVKKRKSFAFHFDRFHIDVADEHEELTLSKRREEIYYVEIRRK